MTVLTAKDINKLHEEVFGVAPVITGIEFPQEESLTDKIIDAINSGKPYVEEEVPDGTLI